MMSYGPLTFDRIKVDTSDRAETRAFAQNLLSDARTLPSGSDGRMLLMMLYGTVNGFLEDPKS